MGKTLAYKILENHLVEGTLAPGEAITIKIDQTLTQDSTGTMAYLQLPEDTACCSPSRATASAISFSWKITVNRARLCWDPTATLQQAAVWA